MVIYVTNRKLCKHDFLQQIEQLAKGKPHAIMLREKDLPLDEYEALAGKIDSICQKYDVPVIINQNLSVAEKVKDWNGSTFHAQFKKVSWEFTTL